jgi:type IV pilus assembly protein PilE
MKQRQRGFTLVELMLVVAVIAVLAAIAIPLYQEYILRAKRNACEAVMVSVAGVFERRHSAANSYMKPTVTAADDPAHLPGDTPTSRPTCPEKGPKSYDLSVDNVTASSWTLIAKPYGTQEADKCGTLAINHLGQKFASGLPPTTAPDFDVDPGSCW